MSDHLTNEELVDEVLDILNFDIDDITRRRLGHLSLHHHNRTRLWHRHLYEMNQKLIELRLTRAELLVERGRA